jgi:hypothetical protein
VEHIIEPGNRSTFGEFDRLRQRSYPPDVTPKTRRSIYVSQEIIEAARHRGVSVGDYIASLHVNARSVRIAYVASLYRSFGLLEMARVPVDPAYFELVDGVLGEEEGRQFRRMAGDGTQNALVRAAARLLGADTRAAAVEAVLHAAQRAQVPHEGFFEASRLLEATYLR